MFVFFCQGAFAAVAGLRLRFFYGLLFLRIPFCRVLKTVLFARGNTLSVKMKFEQHIVNSGSIKELYEAEHAPGLNALLPPDASTRQLWRAGPGASLHLLGQKIALLTHELMQSQSRVTGVSALGDGLVPTRQQRELEEQQRAKPGLLGWVGQRLRLHSSEFQYHHLLTAAMLVPTRYLKRALDEERKRNDSPQLAEKVREAQQHIDQRLLKLSEPASPGSADAVDLSGKGQPVRIMEMSHDLRRQQAAYAEKSESIAQLENTQHQITVQFDSKDLFGRKRKTPEALLATFDENGRKLAGLRREAMALKSKMEGYLLPVRILAAATDVVNFGLISHANDAEQKRYAQLILHFQAPLLAALGRKEQAVALEEQAVLKLSQKDYHRIKSAASEVSGLDEKLSADLENLLHEAGIHPSSVDFRVKDVGSTFRKLYMHSEDEDEDSTAQKYGHDPFRLHDFVAGRGILPGASLTDVRWVEQKLVGNALDKNKGSVLIGKTIAGLNIIGVELRKDYLSNPKPIGGEREEGGGNGEPAVYRALHLVLNVSGHRKLKQIELQLLNEDLHKSNERGAVAHVLFKGGFGPEVFNIAPPEKTMRAFKVVTHGPNVVMTDSGSVLFKRDMFVHEGYTVFDLLHALGEPAGLLPDDILARRYRVYASQQLPGYFGRKPKPACGLDALLKPDKVYYVHDVHDSRFSHLAVGGSLPEGVLKSLAERSILPSAQESAAEAYQQRLQAKKRGGRPSIFSL